MYKSSLLYIPGITYRVDNPDYWTDYPTSDTGDGTTTNIPIGSIVDVAI